MPLTALVGIIAVGLKYSSKYLPIFFLLFFFFFLPLYRLILRGNRNERIISWDRLVTVSPVRRSIFEGSINHSTIIKPTFHPTFPSLPFLRTRSSRRSLALDREMRRSVCLPAPPPRLVWIYNGSTGRLWIRGEEGNTRNEDDRIRRGFQSRTEIEGPRIEKPRWFAFTRSHLCLLLRKTRKEREEGKVYRKIFSPRQSRVVLFIYIYSHKNSMVFTREFISL